MARLLTGARFRELFEGFRHSADKLETRDRYSSTTEDEGVRQFLAGEPLDLSWLAGWFGMVRAATADGRRFTRVRVVTEPLSDYKRFEMAVCPRTVEAGEDIRYLERDRAGALGIPTRDFWLLDNERLALLHFSDLDLFLGAQVVTDPTAIAQHRRWFDLAKSHATPFATYIASRPGTPDPGKRS